MFNPATAKRGDKVMAEDDEATFIAFVPAATQTSKSSGPEMAQALDLLTNWPR